MSLSPKVYAIDVNPEWWAPFAAAFAADNVPASQWLLTDRAIDVSAERPQGSSGRGCRPRRTRATAHSRRSTAALRASGIDVPRTVAVFGIGDLKHRAGEFPVPYISKHTSSTPGSTAPRSRHPPTASRSLHLTSTLVEVLRSCGDLLPS